MEIAVPFIIKDLIVPVLHFAFYLPHKSWCYRSPATRQPKTATNVVEFHRFVNNQ